MKLSPHIISSIASLRAKNYTYQKIADVLGLPLHVVYANCSHIPPETKLAVKIANDLKLGLSPLQISKKYATSKQRVSQIKLKLNLNIPRSSSLSAYSKLFTQEFFLHNLSIKQIAHKYSFSPTWVKQIISRYSNAPAITFYSTDRRISKKRADILAALQFLSCKTVASTFSVTPAYVANLKHEDLLYRKKLQQITAAFDNTKAALLNAGKI
jgi:hypothetical protein